MLNLVDKTIAKSVIFGLIQMLRDKTFSQEQFDREIADYLQSLFDLGMEVEEMKEITASAGLNLEIRIHEAF